MFDEALLNVIVTATPFPNTGRVTAAVRRVALFLLEEAKAIPQEEHWDEPDKAHDDPADDAHGL